MQGFSVLNATDYVKDSRQAINDNFAAVISDFSGTVFPTNNLTGGMKCNRTDRKKVYVLQQDLLTWTEFFDYNNNKITVPNATNATNATNDGNGDNISETYLKEAVTNISESNGTVTVTKSDGSSFTFSSFKLDNVYPVGSIYMSTSPTNPHNLFGGTWEAYAQGRVLIGVGQGTDANGVKKTFNAGATGGEYEHTLTVGEMPIHSHNATMQSSGDHTHSGTAASTGGHTHTINATLDEGNTHSGNSVDSWKYYGTTRSTNSAGAHTHSLTINSTGSHSHNITVNETGSGSAHSVVQPYLTAYIWRRAA